jgi:DNA mismatch endonuclease, patch repair protein
MPDVFTKAKRSEVMSRIRGRGNKDTEVALAVLLRRHGITGWRRHPAMFGKPDFVFRRERVALFVDGCFWHGCPKHSNAPVNNSIFWKTKLTKNVLRDKHVNRQLRRAGWSVVRIWEHELTKNSPACIRRLRRALALNQIPSQESALLVSNAL